ANFENYKAGLFGTLEYRDYFVFDLSSVIEPIVGAQLNLWNPPFNFSSLDPTETYTLFDVSTPLASLQASGSGLTGFFGDLGTGTSYGAQAVSAASNGGIVSVSLNAS